MQVFWMGTLSRLWIREAESQAESRSLAELRSLEIEQSASLSWWEIMCHKSGKEEMMKKSSISLLNTNMRICMVEIHKIVQQND